MNESVQMFHVGFEHYDVVDFDNSILYIIKNNLNNVTIYSNVIMAMENGEDVNYTKFGVVDSLINKNNFFHYKIEDVENFRIYYQEFSQISIVGSDSLTMALRLFEELKIIG